MAKPFYNNLLQKSLKLKQENPFLFLIGCIVLGLLLYYLIILMPLNQLFIQRQGRITKELDDFKWMARASHEILRLQKLSLHEKHNPIESPFAYINQQINEQSWSDMVTDVRQIDENQVQISFKSIPYSTLMTWIQDLYQKSGIFVAEATMERTDPGIVNALFVLRSRGPDDKDTKS